MSRSHPRLVVAGEALVDLIEDPGHAGQFTAVPGGSAANASVAAARLGLDTAYLGRLSTDDFGQLLRGHLEDEGVATRLSGVGDEPTTLAIAHVGEDGGASYTFHLAETTNRRLLAEDLPMLPSAAALAVSLGAITLDDEPMGQALQVLLRREAGRRLVTLDPNVRATAIPDRLAYAGLLDDVVAGVHVVKISDEDLAFLYPHDTIAAVAERWLTSGGPTLVVVTRGGDGATAFHTSAGEVSVGGVGVDVVDTVGAGDTFGAALQVWLAEHDVTGPDGVRALSDDGLRDALVFAAGAAAITCSRRGADPPRREEL